MQTPVTEFSAHLTTMFVAIANLALVVVNSMVQRSRSRRNLPQLSGWVMVGVLLQYSTTVWIVVYFAWAVIFWL